MPTVRINGTEIAYVQTGAGSDVVLVHGLAASSAFWYTGIMLPLRSRYRLTAFDLRGHGKSSMPPDGYTHAAMAKDLAELVDHLGLRRFHLISHSYGGLVALSYAVAHPLRLQSLTLSDVPLASPCDPGPGGDGDWLQLYQDLQAGRAGAEAEEYPELRILEELACPELRQKWRTLAANTLFDPFGSGRGSKRTARKWLELLETTTARQDFRHRSLPLDELDALPVPTLVTYGSRSRWRSSAATLENRLPWRKVVTVAGTGHAHPWEKPARFLESWLEFVAGAGQPEQRSSRRYSVQHRFELQLAAGTVYLVEAVNVSRFGALLRCPVEVNPGQIIRLRQSGAAASFFSGRIVRQQPDGQGTHLGIEFDPVYNAESIEVMTEIIRELGYRASGVSAT